MWNLSYYSSTFFLYYAVIMQTYILNKETYNIATITASL